MFADYTADDPRFAKPLCDALRGLRRDNPEQECGEILASDGWIEQHSRFEDDHDNVPKFYLSESARGLVILIDGTATLTQATSQAQDYIDGVLTRDPSPRMLRTEAVAGFIAGVSTQAPFTRPRRVFMAGWSYGATIAQYLFFYFRTLGIEAIDIKLASFGAPRPAGPAFSAGLAAWSTHTRWMNANDPIPLVPPRIHECPEVAMALGPLVAARFSLFGHSRQGINLSDQGGMTEAPLPASAAVNIPGSIGAWIDSWVNNQANDHSLSRYSARLGLAIARQFPPPLQQAIAGERMVVAPQAQAVAAQRQAVVNLRRQAAIQNATVPTVPPPLGFAANRAKGGIWNITFANTIVAWHTNRKGARAIARAGNVLLRQALHATVFDQAAFTEEIIRFFGSAKAGEEGIKPPLNDVFPQQPV